MCTVYGNKKWALSYTFKVWETRFGSESWFLIATRSSDRCLLSLCSKKSGNNVHPAENINSALSPLLPPEAHFKTHLPTAGLWPAELLTSDSSLLHHKQPHIQSNAANPITVCDTPTAVKGSLHAKWLVYIFVDMTLRIIKSGLARWYRD